MIYDFVWGDLGDANLRIVIFVHVCAQEEEPEWLNNRSGG